MSVAWEMKDSGVAWIGSVPREWDVLRGKDIFAKRSLPAFDADEIVTCFRDGQVTLRRNRREDGFTIALKEHGYQGVRVGDLVVHAMDAFAGAIGISDSNGKCSPVYSICRARFGSRTDLRFYSYVLRDMALNGYIQSVGLGIRERSTDFRFREVEAAFYCQPTLSEQRAIADYLDQQTALIDQRLSTLEEKKTVLAELRKATIHEAVTKGAIWDGDTGEVENLPAGWVMVRIKDVAKLRSGDFVSAEKIESNGEFPVYGGNGLRGYTDSFTHNGEFALVGRQGALCGNINYAKGKFWATEHAVVVRHKRKMVTRWLGEMLCCMNLNQYATASAQPGLSVEIVVNKFLPLPPLDEQSAIANHLDQQTHHIDAQLATLDKQAQVLKELRKAIIHEAVTGKIDLSGVVSGKEKR